MCNVMVQWRMSRCCPRSPPSDPPGALATSSTNFSKGTQVCKWWWHGLVAKTSGEHMEHLFEYAQATVDVDGGQEMVYLDNLDDDGCLDLRADAPQGASRKNAFGKDLCSTASACALRRIQVCQAPCSPSEGTPLSNGVHMAQEQRALGCG